MAKIGHVLMTADTVGGVWTYTLELARAFGEHDIQVSVATMGARMTPQQRSEAAKIENLDVYESSFKLEWMPEPWDDVQQAGEWLLQLEKVLQPDLVHLNGYCHGALNWQSPTVVVCHSCVLSWWEAVKYEQAPLDWMCYEDEVAAGLRSADLVIAPSKTMLKDTIRLYGDLPRAKVIYNARSRGGFHAGEKEKFILTVGRLWDEAKNVRLLDTVASEVAWPVKAAGETHHPSGEDADHTHIEGLGKLNQQELADLYSRAAIYCLPARYEPFGLSALEAAMSGCALVLGDIPSLREIWADAALFVNPEDPEQLKSALNQLINDEEHCKRMGAKAQKRAGLYNIDHMAMDYLDAYEEAMSANAQVSKKDPRIELR